MTSSIKVNKTYCCPNRQNTHASSLFDRMTLVCGPMGGADVNRTANPSNFYFLFCAALKTHAPELNKHRNFIKIIFFFKSKFKFEYIERAQTVTHLFECRWTGCCPSSDRRWMDHSVARCFRVNFFGNFQKLLVMRMQMESEIFLPISDRWLSVSLSAHLSTPLHLFSFKFNFFKKIIKSLKINKLILFRG